MQKKIYLLEMGNLSLCETPVDQKNPSTDLDWRNQWQQILAESLLFASSLLDCCSAKLCQNYEWGKQETKTSSLRVNTLFLNQNIHCKFLNARFECNDIVIFIYRHYPLHLNAKSSDTKCVTLNIKYFCIRIKRIMTVYENYDVVAFKCCIQIFTVYLW